MEIEYLHNIQRPLFVNAIFLFNFFDRLFFCMEACIGFSKSVCENWWWGDVGWSLSNCLENMIFSSLVI